MTELNATQILALAPDASGASSGKALANAAKWKNLGSSDTALWGECQGSGKDPYRAAVDKTDYTAKCSCPSRKFPCKHGIGLMLINAATPLEQSTPPEWVSTWLEGRQKRAEAKTAPPKELSPEDQAKAEKAAAKRVVSRENKVSAGLEELGLWLNDQIKNGIANAPSQPYSYWESMAARLIDAQAPGLARMVRELPTAASTGTQALLEALARIHLIVRAYNQLEKLSPNVQADVRTAIGFTTDKSVLLQQNAPKATWQSLGQIIVHEDNLRIRRSYLENTNTREMALLLDFAVNNQPLTTSLPIGVSLEAELIYYPSNLPMRGILKPDSKILSTNITLHGHSIQAALEQYANALAKLPWLERIPVILENTIICFDGTNWSIQDPNHNLPLVTAYGWTMLALSGGQPIRLFAEFDGQKIEPITLEVDGKIHSIGLHTLPGEQ